MTVPKRSWIYVLTLLLMIGISYVPFQLTIAPERKLRITNRNGNPIVNAKVRQIWRQYALNVHGEIDIQSDPSGNVFLPRREVRTNFFSLISGAIGEISKLGSNAGLRSAETVGIFASGFKDKWFFSITIEGFKELETGVVILEKEK